jgi:hypothetical protein
MSAFETKTTNRPFALVSPIRVVKAGFGVVVIWTTKGSGVGLDVWAATPATEPPMRTGTMMAHKNQKTCFTDSSAIKLRNKDAKTSRLDALGELSSVTRR